MVMNAVEIRSVERRSTGWDPQAPSKIERLYLTKSLCGCVFAAHKRDARLFAEGKLGGNDSVDQRQRVGR